MSNKHFFVILATRNGEFEGSSRQLILAGNEQEAGQIALEGECRSDPDEVSYEEGGVYDMHGELFYRVKSVKEVPPAHAEILLKYF